MSRRFTTQVRCATATLAAERERTVAERDAFTAFEKRVSRLEPRPLDPASSGPPLSISQPQGGSLLERVREAYRETVMRVDHYDEEYGEPLSVNLAAEFGEEVGAAVCGGGAFTSPVKAAVCNAARDAVDRRSVFVDVLDEERAALEGAARDLRGIGAVVERIDRTTIGSFGSLRETRERLCEIEQRCEDLVADRQTTLRTPRVGGRWDAEESLNEYLYAELNVTYPVLADAADAADAVREQRRRIERALARAV